MSTSRRILGALLITALGACTPNAADEATTPARPAQVCVSVGTRCVLPNKALGICHAPHGAPPGAPLLCVSQH